jgi:parallel beta-helix repeat protein
LSAFRSGIRIGGKTAGAGNVISGNTVGFNPYYGLYLKESSFNTVLNNTVFKSVGSSYGVGIYLNAANNNTVTSNYAHFEQSRNHRFFLFLQ